MAKSQWRALTQLKIAALMPWCRENLFRCDPYLVWADATAELDAEPEGEAMPVLSIAVLVELAAPGEVDGFLKRFNEGADGLERLRFLPNGFEPYPPSRFVTGLVDRCGLTALVIEVLDQQIERFTLQNSRVDIARASQTSRVAQKVCAAPEEAPPRDKPLPGTYLGIIDNGLPVLRLRDDIELLAHPAHFWDQGWQPPHLTGTESSLGFPEADDPYWLAGWESRFTMNGDIRVQHRPRGFRYGRRLKRLNADAARKNDRDEYCLSNYFSPPPRETHGAGVLGLLAPWMSGSKGPVQWPRHVSGLAMVQLPTTTVEDASGGSLAMRVLDGLRYILWQEANDGADGTAARSIVANVSYGVHAGPHDGSSMFERAIAEMLDDHPRLHLVLPIGNSARIGCHAQRVLAPRGLAGDEATVLLEVLPDNSRDSFVEFWLPRGGGVELSIQPPGSEQTYEIREGEAKICFDPAPTDPLEPRRIHFGAVYAAEVAQGTNRPMALLAIGRTRAMCRPASSDDARGLNQQRWRDVRGTPGLWTLKVRNLKSDPVTVDAWVERDSAPPDVPRENRQAFFPDSCCEAVRLNNATPHGTLSGIATFVHERLHVIGAMRADGMLSEYSAAGSAMSPALRGGPDAVAVADWSAAVPGLRTTGFVKGAISRISGTSAACAVYARALAEQLARDPIRPPFANALETPPPETACTPERQPAASPILRGQDQRQLFSFEVDF
jgi:hypothetical protein